MTTNLSIDPDLLDRALAVSGERTKKAAVIKAPGVHRATGAEAVARADGPDRMGRRVRLQGRALAPLSLLVDTSVWSLAFRRNAPASAKEVRERVRAIEAGEEIITTGLVLQEILQGFSGPRSRTQILDRSARCRCWFPSGAIMWTRPNCATNADVAAFGSERSTLLEQLCLRHDLAMLTTDRDFRNVAGHCALKLWTAPP
jgi:predicted nucleic acid-binding protein